MPSVGSAARELKAKLIHCSPWYAGMMTVSQGGETGRAKFMGSGIDDMVTVDLPISSLPNEKSDCGSHKSGGLPAPRQSGLKGKDYRRPPTPAVATNTPVRPPSAPRYAKVGSGAAQIR